MAIETVPDSGSFPDHASSLELQIVSQEITPRRESWKATRDYKSKESLLDHTKRALKGKIFPLVARLRALPMVFDVVMPYVVSDGQNPTVTFSSRREAYEHLYRRRANGVYKTYESYPKVEAPEINFRRPTQLIADGTRVPLDPDYEPESVEDIIVRMRDDRLRVLINGDG